jgi:single-strand DNA-binding protein
VVWGRQGESLNQYLVKGKMVGVDGELRQDRWEQDGQNRSMVESIANNLQLLGGNPAGAGGPASSSAQGGGYQERRGDGFSDRGPGSRENPPPGAREGGVDDGFADDIPF